MNRTGGDSMSRPDKNDGRVSDSVHLLISLLVRYPEIGTIKFDPDHHTLKLTFMIQNKESTVNNQVLEKLLNNSLTAYHILEGFSDITARVQVASIPPLMTVHLVRDVYSLGKGEIELVIAILKDQVGQALIVEQDSSLLEEELIFQEELIDNMLENIKNEDYDRSLFGIREEGRVMVFNK
ncbi:hypothetical protein Ga0466249_003049 [Sporomusaceae bacterium BoRhaA]|nr:hypothetical protein [Pelorhabdus rhamnosifermentans]